jgi:hypothetical protein
MCDGYLKFKNTYIERTVVPELFLFLFCVQKLTQTCKNVTCVCSVKYLQFQGIWQTQHLFIRKMIQKLIGKLSGDKTNKRAF